MVYSMDVDQQVHRARETEFDKEADEDVLQRSKPRQLTGLDLAEARLAVGDVATASAMAQKVLAGANRHDLQSVADAARAHFILARVDHVDRRIRTRRSTISRRPSPPARSSACSPGRISIWAACSIWSASATRPCPSTRRRWPSRDGQRIRGLPPSAA